jgi:hypothetical protein
VRSLLLSFLIAPLSWGAACCGGGNLFPTVISGDQRMQVTATTSYATVVGDASVTGAAVSRSTDDRETRGTLRLDAATLISDRWQLGVSLPLVRRFRARNGTQIEGMGLGDASLMVGWEMLPQWTYSAWRPKGILFATVTAPTGRSAVDSTALYQIDAMGRGYWNFSLGSLLQKTWGAWDVLLMGELHQPLTRTLVTDAGDFRLVPAWGASAALGAGWSWGNFRVGAMLSSVFDGPVSTLGLVDEVGNSQTSFPFTVQMAYLIGENVSVGGFYSDNAMLPASNVPLSRSVSLLLQARWDR